MRSMTWLACALFAAVTPLAHAAGDTSKSATAENKAAGAAAGQQTEGKKKTRPDWESMTPEQREEAWKRAQSTRESMTPEQREEARKRAQSKRESMTPEQRAEARKRYEERRKNSERAAAKETKEKTAAKPAAELPPPSAGPR